MPGRWGHVIGSALAPTVGVGLIGACTSQPNSFFFPPFFWVLSGTLGHPAVGREPHRVITVQCLRHSWNRCSSLVSPNTVQFIARCSGSMLRCQRHCSFYFALNAAFSTMLCPKMRLQGAAADASWRVCVYGKLGHRVWPFLLHFSAPWHSTHAMLCFVPMRIEC